MKKLLFASAALFAASVSSFAATISYSNTFPSTATDFTVNLPLTKFNPASFGGVGDTVILNSVTFTLSGLATGSGTLTNNNSTAKTYTVNLSNDLTLVDPLGNVLAETLPIFTSSITVAGKGASGTASGTSGTFSNTQIYTDALTLGLFTGVGTATTTVDGDGASGFSGASNTNFSATTASSGGAQVTYNYTVIPASGTPEPATMGLLGSALVGLGLLKFRSKK